MRKVNIFLTASSLKKLEEISFEVAVNAIFDLPGEKIVEYSATDIDEVTYLFTFEIEEWMYKVVKLQCLFTGKCEEIVMENLFNNALEGM